VSDVWVRSYSFPVSPRARVWRDATWLVTKGNRLDVLRDGVVVAQFAPGSWSSVGDGENIAPTDEEFRG
jgi:hypothetical protein